MKTCKYCGETKPVSEFHVGGLGVTNCCTECHTKRSLQGKKNKKEALQLKNEAANARLLRLKDFTPRELMKELSDRGYEGKLRYVRIEEIDITNF